MCLCSSLVEVALSPPKLSLELLLGVAAAGAAVLLLGAASSRPALVVLGAALAAVPEAITLSLSGPAALAPVLGALLLAGAELGLWSVEAAPVATEEHSVTLFRSVRLIGLCLAGCGVGELLALAAAAPLGGGFDLTLLGTLAAIGISAGLLLLGREVLSA